MKGNDGSRKPKELVNLAKMYVIVYCDLIVVYLFVIKHSLSFFCVCKLWYKLNMVIKLYG